MFALIPAAGVGERMQLGKPKQYVHILNKPLIWYTIMAFLNTSRILRVYIVLSPNDQSFVSELPEFVSHERVSCLYVGGNSRHETVLNGLAKIKTQLGDIKDPWVLVHDAARPAITPLLIDRLIDAVLPTTEGGLLATPVADTLKAQQHDQSLNAVLRTIPRQGLWQAQTPQMFRLQCLHDALLAAHGTQQVTDESSAIEQMGLKPLLVPSNYTNFKVTYPEDLALMTLILQQTYSS